MYRTLSAVAFAVVALSAPSASSAAQGAQEAERMGGELHAMLARGEPVGRIEARWENLLGELPEGEAFLAIESFLRHGLGAQEPELTAILTQLGEREALTRLHTLSKLAATEAPATKSRLIAIETGISELADHLRRIEKAVGESESSSTLARRRSDLEALGRTARDLRRSARRNQEAK